MRRVIDSNVRSLLTVVRTGSYTKAAAELNLTQPAVSYHIRQLEEEFHIRIFKTENKVLVPTEEGRILIMYTERIMSIYQQAQQAIEDSRKKLQHLNLGITQTVGEHLIPQVIALYCRENSEVHVSVVTDDLKGLYRRMNLYEIDMAVVDGAVPAEYNSELLDTDELCLIVSPHHRFARRKSVSLDELKPEKMILRTPTAGTRELFDSYLMNHSENIGNFNLMMEIDNLTITKDLVALDMGVSVISRSACREDERTGRLVAVPIQDANITRDISIVTQKDFSHREIVEDLKRIYRSIQ